MWCSACRGYPPAAACRRRDRGGGAVHHAAVRRAGARPRRGTRSARPDLPRHLGTGQPAVRRRLRICRPRRADRRPCRPDVVPVGQVHRGWPALRPSRAAGRGQRPRQPDPLPGLRVRSRPLQPRVLPRLRHIDRERDRDGPFARPLRDRLAAVRIGRRAGGIGQPLSVPRRRRADRLERARLDVRRRQGGHVRALQRTRGRRNRSGMDTVAQRWHRSSTAARSATRARRSGCSR